MSRAIQSKESPVISEMENTLRSTQNGKVIFTKCDGRNWVLLLKNDKLHFAYPNHDRVSNKGSVYLGKVKNVRANINACFVEIADKEICFLPLKNVVGPYIRNRRYDGRILEGDEILVQVEREAQKNKQATITTAISVTTDYFVFCTGSPKINFSGKLSENDKSNLRTLFLHNQFSDHKGSLQQAVLSNEYISIPQTGMIVRTKAAELIEHPEQFASELNDALTQYKNLFQTASHRTVFSCIRKGINIYEILLKELIHPSEYEEILTDDPGIYQELKDYNHLSQNKSIRLYEDRLLSLSNLYSVKTKLDSAINERIWLKSGAYLIIQPTEAMTVIDVNSGKYEAKKDTADYHLKINLEAASEIAIQLRLRNLSGIILVDFINMSRREDESTLLNIMREYTVNDPAGVTVIDITSLGLMEITRKKIYRPLSEQLTITEK